MALKFDGYPFALWKEWSKQSDKYQEGVCEAKWESFNRKSGDVITSASILHEAKRNGWDEYKMISDRLKELAAKKELTQKVTIDDPRQEARDFLKEHAVDLYQMRKKSPQEYFDAAEELIKQTGYGKREFTQIIDHAGKIKNANLVERSAPDVSIPDEVEEKLKELSCFMYLEDHGRGYLTQIVMDEVNGFTRSKITAKALKEGMYAGYDVFLRTVASGENSTIEPVNMIDYWNQPFKYGHDRGPAVYKRVDFDPRPQPEERIYNLFTSFALQPVFGQDVAEFLQFLFVNICGKDKEAYDFFLSFFAHLVQKPWELPMVAIVIRGEKRSGKSGIVDLMSRIIGRYTTVITQWDQVIGKFNNHLAGKLLVTIDDATWGGYREGVGSLNNLVTGRANA